jgi:hypothetical protein
MRRTPSPFLHKNGFVLSKDGTVVVFALKLDGISGGGNVEPLEKLFWFNVLNCSNVGGFVVLVNGFAVRAVGVEPNGLLLAARGRC